MAYMYCSRYLWHDKLQREVPLILPIWAWRGDVPRSGSLNNHIHNNQRWW